MIPLLPGDVVFCGTPAGVGLGRDPQRWLAPATRLVQHHPRASAKTPPALHHTGLTSGAPPATGPPFRPAGR
ncbi:hypothetical protein [Streptomyces sp. KL116D]|uniref:hypothetical protein n=1 Tax=Streptomyces sp. KL116D TaxID=3045152 RepID=UPI00355630A6